MRMYDIVIYVQLNVQGFDVLPRVREISRRGRNH